MYRYILNRLLLSIPTLIGAAALVFILMRLIPGDICVVRLGSGGSINPTAVANCHAQLGLDRSLVLQFFDFIAGFARGDFGTSMWSGKPVSQEIATRIPVSLEIALLATLVAVLIAIPLGTISALHQNSWLDHIVRTVAIAGIATPSFWLGIVLIYVFSIQLGWLPSARMGGPSHYVLPVVTLSAFLVAGMMRLVRSSMLEVLDSEFVKLARIKGLSQTVVVWKHCLRNALIPVVTLFGVFFALLVTGAIVTETVFAWPGVGRLTYEAVIFRDYPLLQAVILLKGVIVLGVNLAVDVLYAYLAPRVRYA
jgi:peptide/nickel transport system permease protein